MRMRREGVAPFVVSCVLMVGCVAPSAPDQPDADPTGDPMPRGPNEGGIEGSNCAGAAPVMSADDGVAYPFQSVVAFYYRVLSVVWTEVDHELVIATSVPAYLDDDEAFYEWQAKSVQIY